MKAIILAGGRGKRLGALCRYRPKPMLLIGGRPFLEYLLAWLKSYGFRHIIICSGYLSGQIEEYFGPGEKIGLKIEYSVEKKPLGTGGALRQARSHIDGDFILLNGDSFVAADLKDMLAYHYSKGNKITMAVARVDNPKRYGRVAVDTDGQVVNFNEKSGEGEFINAGLYICRRDLLKKLPEEGKVSLERDVFFHLGKGWIGAYKTSGFFIDMGTVSDYRRLKSMSDRLFYLFE